MPGALLGNWVWIKAICAQQASAFPREQERGCEPQPHTGPVPWGHPAMSPPPPGLPGAVRAACLPRGAGRDAAEEGRVEGGRCGCPRTSGVHPVPQRVGCWGGGPGVPLGVGTCVPSGDRTTHQHEPFPGWPHKQQAAAQSATSHGCPPRTPAVPRHSSPRPPAASPAPSPAPTCCPSGCRHPRALWRSLCSWRARTSHRPRAPPALSLHLSRRRCRRSRSGWEKARGEHGAVRFWVLGRQNCTGGCQTPPAPAACAPWHGRNPISWSRSISRGATRMQTAQPACQGLPEAQPPNPQTTPLPGNGAPAASAHRPLSLPTARLRGWEDKTARPASGQRGAAGRARLQKHGRFPALGLGRN